MNAARAPFAEYAASLRPAIQRGLGAIPLGATMQAELSRLGSMGSLDPGVLDATATSEALQTIRESYALADALEQTRTDIAVYQRGGVAAVPNAPSVGLTALAGAASGAAVGGPIGAAVGGIGGLVAGLGGKEAEGAAKRKVKKSAAQAYQALSPAGVESDLAAAAGTAREQSLVSGVGNLISQDLQAALSRSGLRDSALGTLTSVAAAAAPEQVARTTALSRGLASTRSRVETILGAPVRQPQRDRLTDALGAAAEGYLLYRQLFPKGTSTSSGSLLPGPEDLFSTSPPGFQIPNESSYLPVPR